METSTAQKLSNYLPLLELQSAYASEPPIEIRMTNRGPTFTKILDWVKKNYWKPMKKALDSAGVDEIYMALCGFQDNKTHISHPGIALLATEAGIRKANVAPCLTWLEEHGLIRLKTPAQGRMAAEYFIVQIPAGARILKPDFSGSRDEISGSRGNDEKPTGTGNIEPETQKTEPEPQDSAGTALEGSLREPHQTAAVCCEFSPKIQERANRHTDHAMQISSEGGKGWNYSATSGIMAKLCMTHRDQDITWVIEHTGPKAITPGLIRDVVLKRPSAAQIKERKAALAKIQADIAAQKELERQSSVIAKEGIQANRDRIRAIRESLK